MTNEEARTWASRLLSPDDSSLYPQVPAPGHASLRYEFEREPGHRLFYLAREVVRALGPFHDCLLWATETGVWPSNENLHLYYRLRNSYGDHHTVEERPGTLVLEHEAVDLVSFVHLGMLFGWDMLLLTSHDYGRVFVSHDGWFELSEITPTVIRSLREGPSDVTGRQAPNGTTGDKGAA